MRNKRIGTAVISSMICIACVISSSCASLPVINADGQKADVPETHEFNIRTDESGYMTSHTATERKAERSALQGCSSVIIT